MSEQLKAAIAAALAAIEKEQEGLDLDADAGQQRYGQLDEYGGMLIEIQRAEANYSRR